MNIACSLVPSVWLHPVAPLMESKFRRRIYLRHTELSCTNPKLPSEKKEEVLIGLPPIGLAASAYGLSGQETLRPELSRNDNSRATLLFATIADHLQIRYLHVSMFGGNFIHIMFFGLGLDIFLRAMHFRIRNHAGDRDCVADVITQLVAVALEFPSAALRRSKSVLVGVIALLQAARERPCFIVSGTRCVLRRRPAGCDSQQEQRKKCHRELQFH